MTTMNEAAAAARVRSLIRALSSDPSWVDDFDEALWAEARAERRATVERIRERFQATTSGYPDFTAKDVEVAAVVFGDLLAILDDEAAR